MPITISDIEKLITDFIINETYCVEVRLNKKGTLEIGDSLLVGKLLGLSAPDIRRERRETAIEEFNRLVRTGYKLSKVMQKYVSGELISTSF